MNNTDYKKAKFKDGLLKAIIYIFLGVWAIIVLFPFYWMILTSLKSYGTYNGEYIPKFFTLSPTIENYIFAFTEVPLASYFANTLIFALVTTALMLVVPLRRTHSLFSIHTDSTSVHCGQYHDLR